MKKIENDNKCFYCELDFGKCYANSSIPLRETKDHIIPRSKGGNGSVLNIVKSCHQCNYLKGCCLPEDFAQELIWKIKRFELGIQHKAKNYGLARLKTVQLNNDKLIAAIAPYRIQLLKSYTYKSESKNKPTVRQREKKKGLIRQYLDNKTSELGFYDNPIKLQSDIEKTTK